VSALIADAGGNLFGTTSSGGAFNLGTVFEIAKTRSGYATTPTILVSFSGADELLRHACLGGAAPSDVARGASPIFLC
jgi:uncharacterized repeat protein (TIGR03803 family)